MDIRLETGAHQFLFVGITSTSRYNPSSVEHSQNQSSQTRKFRLIERIGKGGFGEVYLAEMSTPSGFTKTVAIKLLRTDIQQVQATAQRMRDEARLLGMLRHRAIVQAEDLITLAGRTAVVMEYIPGVNHSWIIHPNRYEEDIPPRVILSIIGHIADALDAAYNRPSTVTGKPLQVLHRDIKPGNIRVTPDGEVKVLDFGIARSDHMDREASTTEYQLGSLPYMAPELMAGRSASTSSDVYSLGVTFYESIARRRFGWAGEESDSHNQQIENRFGDIEWSPFGESASDTEQLLRSMLSFDARERPSARQVLEYCRELEHKAPGVSLESWAPSALEKIKVPENSHEEHQLAGKILFEEVSTSAIDKADLQNQVDAATQVLTEQELSDARSSLSPDKKSRRRSPRKELIWSVILLLAAIVIAYGSLLSKDDNSTTKLPAQTNTNSDSPKPQANENTPQTPASDLPNMEDLPALEKPIQPPATTVTENPSPDVAEKISIQQTPKSPTQKDGAAQTPKAKERPTEQDVLTDEPAPILVSIRINSRPFRIPVYVDGEYRGKTPIEALELKAGSHTLLFKDEQYPKETTIQVRPDGKSLWTYLQAEQIIQ